MLIIVNRGCVKMKIEGPEIYAYGNSSGTSPNDLKVENRFYTASTDNSLQSTADEFELNTLILCGYLYVGRYTYN